ncbi:MAG: energy-coupling factor transport system permease protein [Phormidesmis priestleyi Ana]|uniref:Energy-coupling factor transport system permease protein n=1 Tax=Phormidesmis priestleyi Ana TaxID=1666911 RepID=A0A0P8DGU6_9CYAN|nr:MAG: energy-coupling factor transport system permease protein [Phormidesmis priestleyi Ana]
MDLLRSLPIGLYMEQPVTWLHRIDARVKVAWLLSLLLAPVLANSPWRIAIVVFLVLLTITARIPWRVWRQQMGLLLVFGVIITLLVLIAPDGIAISQQPRLPTAEILANWPEDLTPPERLPILPDATGYRYDLINVQIAERPFNLGFNVTQRSLRLAIKISTLLFTLIYATTLFLLTTAPEEITEGIADLMQPLRRLGLPVTEISLTLTLALRFIPLVLEEVQNLVRSVRTRAIKWQKLGVRGSLQIWLMVSERLIENLLLRAEQIASAMQVRGFTSPDQHRVVWHQLRLRWWDWLVLSLLGLFWWGRVVFGGVA